MSSLNTNRRDFLRIGAAASALPFAAKGHATERQSAAEVKRYVTLGRTGLEISDISFGASTLRLGQEHLVHHALDRGINYFDTAEGYARTESEQVLGKVLKDRRDQVIITSKAETEPDSSRESLMQRLDASLRRLQTDYVDIFMNHAVNDVAVLSNPEWHAFIDKAKEQGKIRFAGMSGHAGYLLDCLDYAFDQDMADVILVAHTFGEDPQFYQNLTRWVDWVAKHPKLPERLARAKELDVGVIAMKTLMGARLNDMRPYETGNATFAQAAFRWVLSNPNVDALIVTMREEETIDEYLGASGYEELAAGDMELLERYAKQHGASYCRFACNDCRGACPYGVPISDLMRTRMYATDYRDVTFAREEYALLETNGEACLSCSGEPCANACTHGLPLAELCAPTHEMLA